MGATVASSIMRLLCCVAFALLALGCAAGNAEVHAVVEEEMAMPAGQGPVGSEPSAAVVPEEEEEEEEEERCRQDFESSLERWQPESRSTMESECPVGSQRQGQPEEDEEEACSEESQKEEGRSQEEGQEEGCCPLHFNSSWLARQATRSMEI